MLASPLKPPSANEGGFLLESNAMMKKDVVIVGGGAAGLMCAIEAGKRGRSVLVLEHNKAIGEKIRISGGGRCNFTNTEILPHNYISHNPHFCKSALAQYPSSAFVKLVEDYGIAYHEKKLGQLFCDRSSRQIITMLLKEASQAGVEIRTAVKVDSVRKSDHFELETLRGTVEAISLVIATGGLSVPKLGATDFGYVVARQFGLKTVTPRPGLVPLTFGRTLVELLSTLSGVSIDASVSWNKITFRENILFTHRGLSGPAILQLSSYWNEGESISINLLPEIDALELLKSNHESHSYLSSVLEQYLPKRFCQQWAGKTGADKPLRDYSQKELRSIAAGITDWKLQPIGTEGFEKAEVTVGGVDTDELSSKTMEAKRVPGLFFIGEVVDVTGWLGGYNFQWAWSSGWVAGQHV